MANKKTDLLNDPRHILLRITRVHFVYILIYMASLIIFDSWNLLSHGDVAKRWTAAGSLMIVNLIIWYLCRAKLNNDKLYRFLLIVLIACDILFAAVNVYWQRGMSAKSVMLFAIPIISAGLAKSRSLVLSTTGISAAAYSIAAVRYFNDNYGQGYKIELYGEIFFYSGILLIIALLMLISFRKAPD